MSFYNVTSSEYSQFYHTIIMGKTTAQQPEPEVQTTTMVLPVEVSETDKSELIVWENESSIEQPIPVKGPPFKERKPDEFIDMSPPDYVPYKYENEARLYGQFCSTVLYRLEQCQSRVDEWKQITSDFNNKELIPELYQLVGRRSERSLRIWLERYLSNNHDMYSLLHKSKNQSRGRKVSFIEQNYLLSLLLQQEFDSGQLARPFRRPIQRDAAYYLLTAAAQSPSVKVRAFRRWLLDEVRRQQPA